MIGGIRETQEMLDFCAEHGIGAEIEVIPADRDQRGLRARPGLRRPLPLRDRHRDPAVTQDLLTRPAGPTGSPVAPVRLPIVVYVMAAGTFLMLTTEFVVAGLSRRSPATCR